MVLTLYKYSSETNRLDKSNYLSGGVDRSGEIKGTFNIDAPQFIFTYPGDLTGYNYLSAVVDGVTQYYYARITGDVGGRLIATCTRDPLMTFKTGIAETDIIARRSALETKLLTDPGCNAYLPDSQQPVLVPTIDDYYLLHTFTPGSYILVTIG